MTWFLQTTPLKVSVVRGKLTWLHDQKSIQYTCKDGSLLHDKNTIGTRNHSPLYSKLVWFTTHTQKTFLSMQEVVGKKRARFPPCTCSKSKRWHPICYWHVCTFESTSFWTTLTNSCYARKFVCSNLWQESIRHESFSRRNHASSRTFSSAIYIPPWFDWSMLSYTRDWWFARMMTWMWILGGSTLN